MYGFTGTNRRAEAAADGVADPEYCWAVVGEPTRWYLWALTREPVLNTDMYRAIEQIVTEHGYDASRLVRTPQEQGKREEGTR